ncbi:tetratricopeptide repeat protein [Polaribacter marinivivus]|uniref:Tetratricopeptide repeat protein n=1 Tax=Polaribacter marinivivus TaxID=1524260 RepID=A0ABV8R9J9_9FLAO
MKKTLFILFTFILLTSCTSQKNSDSFIEATSGRYLFNANEVLEIYFEDAIMHAKWRGNDDIELLKVNDSAFYMKELNEKMLFVSKPKMHIELAPKTEHKGVIYRFDKMEKGEKTPSEYFNDKEYDKALTAFKTIKEKDSLNPNVSERRLNTLAYRFLRNEEYEEAKELFKINMALYPNSSNVYDSMGDLYFSKKDTVNAIIYYKKALAINPENRSSKARLSRLTKK